MRFWTPRLWLTLAAAGGFVSVAAGAFAAHGVADPKAAEWLRTGSAYALAHMLAVLACGGLRARVPKAAWAAPLFLAGATLFAGSLYAMAFGADRWLGAVTAVGGLLLLAGWAVLVWALATSPAD